MGTGWGRGRQVPHCSASSTTRPSARPRLFDRCTSSRYGPNLAWSSHSPRAQNRHDPRAALAQNQQSTRDSYEIGGGQARTVTGPPARVVDAPSPSVATTETVRVPPRLSPGNATGPTLPKNESPSG